MNKIKSRVWDSNKSQWCKDVRIDSDGSLYPMNDIGEEDMSIDCRKLIAEYSTGIHGTEPTDEIFAGDVVGIIDKKGKSHVGEIVWTAPCFSLKIAGAVKYDGGAVKTYEDDTILNDWCDADVIKKLGNIHDNPELLK